MKPLPLLIAAGVAWWLLTREQRPTPQLAATSSVFTLQGRTYVVVGAPTAEGLVPVQYRPPAGMMAAAVVEMFDPATGTIVRGA